MAKFCANCGAELNEGADVCLKCGANVKQTSSVSNQEQAFDKSAQTGFILGLISIVAWFIPLFGYPVTIAGIVCSNKGRASVVNKGKATAGLVLSIIFLVVTLINSFLGVLMSFQ